MFTVLVLGKGTRRQLEGDAAGATVPIATACGMKASKQAHPKGFCFPSN